MARNSARISHRDALPVTSRSAYYRRRGLLSDIDEIIRHPAVRTPNASHTNIDALIDFARCKRPLAPFSSAALLIIWTRFSFVFLPVFLPRPWTCTLVPFFRPRFLRCLAEIHVSLSVIRCTESISWTERKHISFFINWIRIQRHLPRFSRVFSRIFDKFGY